MSTSLTGPRTRSCCSTNHRGLPHRRGSRDLVARQDPRQMAHRDPRPPHHRRRRLARPTTPDADHPNPLATLKPEEPIWSGPGMAAEIRTKSVFSARLQGAPVDASSFRR